MTLKEAIQREESSFWARVYKENGEDGCWLWEGGRGTRGYGLFHFTSLRPIKTRGVSAHRYAYELLVGRIPQGLVLDHLCRVTSCVNPQHLEPVTTRENIARGVNVTAYNMRKTHCPLGHPYTGDNLKISVQSKRVCITCAYIATTKYSKKRLARLLVERKERGRPISKTCRRGHLYTEETTYNVPGTTYRQCRTCRHERSQLSRTKEAA